jgi:iron complex transport system ATP-binding protein
MSVNVVNLSFSYGSLEVLHDISFTAADGELLAVMGPNGGGKSTLFQCILGLLSGYKGQLIINGQDIRKIGIHEMSKQVAYIPQLHSPVFNFKVFDVILMGTSSQVSAVRNPGREQVALAEQALETMGISHLKDRGYTRISGGERQLVLIARALAQKAKTLVMDEPTSNLDFGNQIRILTHIKKLARDGYTIIISTHNPDQASLYADKAIALFGGNIFRQGKPAEIITSELILKLYNVEVDIHSLNDGKIRVCTPHNLN